MAWRRNFDLAEVLAHGLPCLPGGKTVNKTPPDSFPFHAFTQHHLYSLVSLQLQST
jgi:hypothetical protein